MIRLSFRSEMPATPAELFAWHARPGAFERLAPPWDDVRVTRPARALADGERVELLLRRPPGLRARWIAEIRDVRPPHGFRDVQVLGPFRTWEHEHRIEPAASGGAWLDDRISLAPPFGIAGRAALPFVRSAVSRVFRYRHRTLRDDFRQFASLRGVRPMKILVTGASGLVGRALVPFLGAAGHTVVRAVRGRAGTGEVSWDPAGRLDPAALAGVEAVVHLAGENIAGARWTPEVKERIRASRVDGTSVLARALAAMPRPPRVLVCASAVGIYGNRGDEPLTEDAAPGAGFLPDVCRAWEGAAEPARAAGVRVVHLRLGVVLAAQGGALARMLLPFRMGAGGVIGSGRQWMPWIAIDDVLGAVLHSIATESVSGAVNGTAPGAATNRDFTKALGRALGRPAILPMPAFAARLAFGEMADDLLLASAKVVPARLAASGYGFRHPEIEGALRHVLGRG